MENESKHSKSSLTLIILIWVFWTLLFLSWPSDLMIMLLKDGEVMMTLSEDRQFFATIIVVGFVNLALSFVVRWFVFRFLIHEKRIKPGTVWAFVFGLIGGGAVLLLTKAVETYGLILSLRSGSLLELLIFWVPGLIAMIIHLPCWLIPKRVARA